jgi:ABC-type phosphate/phosphonate transport system ATPase subunit
MVAMIRVIIGEKGSGKTKALMKCVDEAVKKDHGSVAFVCNDKSHVYDLSYKVRMVDASEYNISNTYELYGMLCGIHSQDYDTTHIFVDGLTKITSSTVDEIAAFLDKCSAFAEQFGIEMVMTISISADTAPVGIKKYTA